MALVDSRTGDLELSLKLYHRREVQLDYQQLMTEAPMDALVPLSYRPALARSRNTMCEGLPTGV